MHNPVILTGDRLLFMNTGADFAAAEYESKEWFAELSIPLFRDSWMGEYAELSGSYRSFDYTTAGEGDVYGVNLVYRPIQDITFKSSFNTSFRAPNLNDLFAPQSTFVNQFQDRSLPNSPTVPFVTLSGGNVDPALFAAIIEGRFGASLGG